MSAKAWNKRRRWKRVIIALHHVRKGAPRAFVYGEELVVVGPRDELYRFLVYPRT